MDEKEIEKRCREFCQRLGFNPEQDMLLDGERMKLWERYAREIRKHHNHKETEDFDQAAPLQFWKEQPAVDEIRGDTIVLKTKPGHNQDRVVSIEHDPKDGEFIFTEQCDECFWVSHKKADAITALEEAIRWIKSKS